MLFIRDPDASFQIEETKLPYIAVFHLGTFLEEDVTCDIRIERHKFQVQAYDYQIGRIDDTVLELEDKLDLKSLGNLKDRIFLFMEVGGVEKEEIEAQIWRGNIDVNVLAQKTVNYTNRTSATTGETVLGAVYNRFHEHEQFNLVSDFWVGFREEKPEYPYCHIPSIRTFEDTRTTTKSLDRQIFNIDIYSTKLEEIENLIEKIENVYDNAALNIPNQHGLMLEWNGFSMQELETQIWKGSVTYSLFLQRET